MSSASNMRHWVDNMPPSTALKVLGLWVISRRRQFMAFVSNILPNCSSDKDLENRILAFVAGEPGNNTEQYPEIVLSAAARKLVAALNINLDLNTISAHASDDWWLEDMKHMPDPLDNGWDVTMHPVELDGNPVLSALPGRPYMENPFFNPAMPDSVGVVAPELYGMPDGGIVPRLSEFGMGAAPAAAHESQWVLLQPRDCFVAAAASSNAYIPVTANPAQAQYGGGPMIAPPVATGVSPFGWQIIPVLPDEDFLPGEDFLPDEDFLHDDDFLPDEDFKFLPDEDFLSDEDSLADEDFLSDEDSLADEDFLPDEDW